MSDRGDILGDFIRAIRQGYPRLPYTGEIGNKAILEEAIDKGTSREEGQAVVDYTRDLMMDVLDEVLGRADGSSNARTRILDLAMRGLLSERGLI